MIRDWDTRGSAHACQALVFMLIASQCDKYSALWWLTTVIAVFYVISSFYCFGRTHKNIKWE